MIGKVLSCLRASSRLPPGALTARKRTRGSDPSHKHDPPEDDPKPPPAPPPARLGFCRSLNSLENHSLADCMSVTMAVQRRFGHAKLSSDDAEGPAGLDRSVYCRAVGMTTDRTSSSHAFLLVGFRRYAVAADYSESDKAAVRLGHTETEILPLPCRTLLIATGCRQ